jgi:type I restriction enzyme, S subunit
LTEFSKMRKEMVACRIECLIREGLLEIGDGYRAKNEELSSSGLPFARAGNINGGFNFAGADRFPVSQLSRVGRKISMPGDVLFTSKGTVGRFAYVRDGTEQFVYSPQLCFWRSLDHHKVHPRWLYYWMQGGEFLPQFLGVARETDMADYVSLQNQRRFHITLPPFAEQVRVATVLGQLDDKIELNRRICATLEEMARAIFRSWFVDFDPVRAKVAAIAEGRDPERAAMAVISGKNEEELDTLPPETLASLRATAALFPDSFTASEIGEIPKGWFINSLREVAPLNTRSVNPTQQPETLFQHFSIPAYDAGKMPVEEPGSRIKSNKYRVRRNTVLVSKLNPNIPRVWLSQDVSEHAVCSTEFMQFTPSRPEVTRYVYLYMLMPEMQEQILQRVTGSTGSRQRAQPAQIEAIPIVVPPTEILHKADALFRPLLDREATARKESITLAALRDTLLPKLLSGELRAESVGVKRSVFEETEAELCV